MGVSTIGDDRGTTCANFQKRVSRIINYQQTISQKRIYPDFKNIGLFPLVLQHLFLLRGIKPISRANNRKVIAQEHQASHSNIFLLRMTILRDAEAQVEPGSV